MVAYSDEDHSVEAWLEDVDIQRIREEVITEYEERQVVCIF
jgi:hypothetical protein